MVKNTMLGQSNSFIVLKLLSLLMHSKVAAVLCVCLGNSFKKWVNIIFPRFMTDWQHMVMKINLVRNSDLLFNQLYSLAHLLSDECFLWS